MKDGLQGALEALAGTWYMDVVEASPVYGQDPAYRQGVQDAVYKCFKDFSELLAAYIREKGEPTPNPKKEEPKDKTILDSKVIAKALRIVFKAIQNSEEDGLSWEQRCDLKEAVQELQKVIDKES
jgi:hypothetical protein